MQYVTNTIYPSESRNEEFDFSTFPEIAKNGETISSVVSCIAVPSSITLGATAVLTGGKGATVRVSGAIAGLIYHVEMVILTTGANKLTIVGILNCLSAS